MHVQARAKPAASEADLGLFLERLAANPAEGLDSINIEGVSGSGIESKDDGQFVFVVQHGREADCHDRLTPTYGVQWTTDLYQEAIPPENEQDGPPAAPADPNRPGVLLEIIRHAKEGRDPARSSKVDGVLIGAFTGKKNRFFAQVTFEDFSVDDRAAGATPGRLEQLSVG